MPGAIEVAEKILKGEKLSAAAVRTSQWVLDNYSKLMESGRDTAQDQPIDKAFMAQIEKASKVMSESTKYFKGQVKQ